MKNYRAVLGLGNGAGADEIKGAFRKLAMKHHPDRGGDQEVFKSINEAYRELESSGFAPHYEPRQAPPRQRPGQSSGGGWAQPEPPSGTWQSSGGSDELNDILDKMRGFSRAPPPRNPAWVQPNSEVTMSVSIAAAMRGFEWRITRQKQNGFVEHLDVVIPPGLPDGHRGRYTLSDGSTQVLVMRIEAGDFRLRGTSGSVGTIFEAGITTGDVEVDVPMDAIDLITGTWFEVQDFLGERLTVRVPAGFNPDQRLKVAGKGYLGWNEEQAAPAKHRRDMYIKLRATYNPPEKIDRAKIQKLYDAAGMGNE